MYICSTHNSHVNSFIGYVQVKHPFQAMEFVRPGFLRMFHRPSQRPTTVPWIDRKRSTSIPWLDHSWNSKSWNFHGENHRKIHGNTHFRHILMLHRLKPVWTNVNANIVTCCLRSFTLSLNAPCFALYFVEFDFMHSCAHLVRIIHSSWLLSSWTWSSQIPHKQSRVATSGNYVHHPCGKLVKENVTHKHGKILLRKEKPHHKA